MFRRMQRETPEEKWTRLQSHIQKGILKAYPNPKRNGCPNRNGLGELAIRSARFDEIIEGDPQWRHVTHCSSCYGEYLEEFRSRWRPPAPAD